MNDLNVEIIRTQIMKTCHSHRELKVGVARDVAIHMTDWIADLEGYIAFCEITNDFLPAQIDRILTNFLVHAPNHIAAAGKLYADMVVKDFFHEGAADVDFL
jgi:hypothetical protein